VRSSGSDTSAAKRPKSRSRAVCLPQSIRTSRGPVLALTCISPAGPPEAERDRPEKETPIKGITVFRHHGGSLACGRHSWDAAHMPFSPSASAEDVIGQPLRSQFEAFLDEHRSGLNRCLDGLTEEQARRSLVPSRTTLLSLVKHVTFVEKVWFDEAITCRSRADIGVPATPDESFILDDTDTIASVRQAHREACDSSRRATASMGLDDMLYGNRRGPLPLRWVYLHMLRELAQHCGHADILREQILSS
jgi:hypothetical protein